MISRNGRVDADRGHEARCRDRRSSFRWRRRRTATSGSARAAPASLASRAPVSTRFTDGLPDLKVNCLLAMDDRDVWIGTDKGVVRWTGTEISRSRHAGVLTNLQALAMIRDRAGNVWIAAGSDGLVRVDDRGRASRWESKSAPGPNVSSVFEDRDGNIWVGTDRGIERWRDPVFTSFSTAQGLPLVGRRTRVRRRSRTRVVCADERRPVLDRGRRGRPRHARPASIATSCTRSPVRGDDVWVGRQRGGVTRLRRAAAGWSAMRLTEAEGLPQNSVYAVALARDGALWAGTPSAGASRIVERGRHDLHHRERPGLQYHHVDRRRPRRNDLVRNTRRAQRILAGQLAHLHHARWIAVERRQYGLRGSARHPLGRHDRRTGVRAGRSVARVPRNARGLARVDLRSGHGPVGIAVAEHDRSRVSRRSRSAAPL